MNAEEKFRTLCQSYVGDGPENDSLHKSFTAETWADPLLAGHRKHVESEQLGFGDAAFHHMWHLILASAHARFGAFHATEIGVFKGQAISLWALLAKTYGYSISIHAISPLAGQPMPPFSIFRYLRKIVDWKFRERLKSADFYPVEDYAGIVRKHFEFHHLNFDDVDLLRGYSSDPAIRESASKIPFQVLYIDGDHTFEGAMADIDFYASKVEVGGWLIMDDASFYLPGSAFWKGHETVSRACKALPSLGFKNVLNIGHNRIFERIEKPKSVL